MVRTLLCWGLVLWVSGCTRAPTEIVLRVETDIGLARNGGPLQSVDVKVWLGDTALTLPGPYALGVGGSPMPGEVVVRAANAEEGRPVRAEVVGHLSGGTMVRREFTTRFSPHRTALLGVFLANRCLTGVTCAVGETCGRYTCEPIARPELPTYEPTTDAGHSLDGAAPGDAGVLPIDAQTAIDARPPPSDSPMANPDGGLLSVTIDPPNPLLTVRGVAAMQPFAAVGRYTDGTQRPIEGGTWSLERDRSGSIDRTSGRFTATGQVGDAIEVRYEIARAGAEPLRATTTLTVRFEGEFIVAPSTGADRTRFATLQSDAAREVLVRYPLADALVPQNVAAPDIQWEQGVVGDVFRVRVSKPHVDVTGYVTHSGAGFRYDWSVDAAGWRALVESDLDAPITLRVDRAPVGGGAAIEGSARTMRVAQGSLAGAVYYWDLREGRILRIREEPNGPVREDFLPRPPQRAMFKRSRCVACHTVSRDGLQMAAAMWEPQGPSTVFDLGRDLTADPAPTRFPVTDTASSPSWVYSSFNANATRLIANRLEGLFLVNPTTGATVTPVTGTLPQGNSVQPSWSPDGNTIAYVSEYIGDGPTAFSASNLSTIPVTAADSFGPITQRVMGASLSTQREAGRALAYPTWTPDSRWLAFQHGPYSESDRSGASAGAPRTRFPAAIYLVAPSGGTPTRLTRASADEAEDDAYFPNFSPFVQGGHYWLVYFSRRSYGNAQAGTRGSGRRQLWVTAISTAITAGADPSNVPYWLPGQDVGSDNVSGFWAPQPCRPRDGECTVSSECCAGTCGPNGTGRLVCNPPPPEAPCRRVNERCGSSLDCCGGLGCVAHACLRPGT